MKTGVTRKLELKLKGQEGLLKIFRQKLIFSNCSSQESSWASSFYMSLRRYVFSTSAAVLAGQTFTHTLFPSFSEAFLLMFIDNQKSLGRGS